MGFAVDVAYDGAAALDWRVDAPIWDTILIAGGQRIITRTENYELASEVIAYLIGGDKSTPAVRAEVTRRVAAFRGQPDFQLPDPLA